MTATTAVATHSDRDIIDRLERLRSAALNGAKAGDSEDGRAVSRWLRNTPRSDGLWGMVQRSYIDSLRVARELPQ